MLHVPMFKLILLSLFLIFVVCPPVEKRPTEKKEEESEEPLGLEYERYMREVVKLLESDENFRKQLENVNASEIRSGKIAEHLNFVDRGIRSKLDELKRGEMDRLKKIFRMKGQLEKNRNIRGGGGGRRGGLDEGMLGHVDPSTGSFEMEDLVKLIKKTSEDLEHIDTQRKEDFKKYEMRKEHDRKVKMQAMNEDERLAEEKEQLQMQQKHKDHPKINHPGNEDQLKEVWEESDGLEKDSFDPRTFFHLHDTNGDGQLDIEELEALFQIELDKVYNSSSAEDDMTERYEEMNRMREHVMSEFDTNKDMMVSLAEFIAATQKEQFKEKEDWQTLDNQTLYSDEDLKRYEEDLARHVEANERPPPVYSTPLPPNNQQGNLHFESQQQQQQNQQQQDQQHNDQQQQHNVQLNEQHNQHNDQQQQQQDQQQQQLDQQLQQQQQQDQQHHQQQQPSN